MELYLFASPAGTQDESPAAVFYKVEGESLAISLCSLFAKDYDNEDPRKNFHSKPVASFQIEERVLMDEMLDWLSQYDDPDPGLYDPVPPRNVFDRAQYAIRASKWEELIRVQAATTHQSEMHAAKDSTDEPLVTLGELPLMSVDDRKNSGLLLLMLLAQAYYTLLESTMSMASWCTVLDIELNQSYFWTVTNITNLLKNHDDLKDFPTTFEPLVPDLYPSTIRDLNWENMVAPDAELFLSTVQEYVHSKGAYDPERGSDAWVFIELFRPGVNTAIERAIGYHKRMQQYCRRMFGSSPLPNTTSSSIEGTHTMKKTVVELDLKGYSDIAREIEEHFSAGMVRNFNEQIQTFIDAGLNAVKAPRDKVVCATTGDGAILAFDNAEDAHRFAEAVHKATEEHNAQKTVPSTKRWFRIGAATGDIAIETTDGIKKIAGVSIAVAVRLETASRTGELLIDTATFAALPAELQELYGKQEQVPGKRKETFQARRCVMIQVQSEEDDHEPAVESILDLFDQLNPRDQLQRLTMLIDMPATHRPPETLTLFQRQDKILDWAAGRHDGRERLAKALRSLVEKQVRP